MRLFFSILAFSLIGLLALGASWHVAPNGSASSAGTQGSPFSLMWGLSSSGPVRRGDTLWIHGGTYAGTFKASLAGTSSAPIIVRNWNGERATIDGGNSGGTAILLIAAQYVWFWGLEVMSSDPGKISTQATSWPTDINYGEGVMIDQGGSGGLGCKFINLVVHDTRQGFSSWKEAIGSEVYGCTVYDNGWIGSDRPHGHNLYIQNVTGGKLFADNLILRAYSHNIQAYGSSAANVDNLTFDGNVGVNGGERNFMLGSPNVAQNPIWRNNFMYVDGAYAGSCNLYLAYSVGYTPGTSNAIVTGNDFAGGKITLYKNAGLTWSNNLVYYTAFADGSDPAPANPGGITTTTRPSSNWISVRANKYEAGRANIVVYNWQGAPTVSVDLSGVLKVGGTFRIRDAQNYYGTPVLSGTYQGGMVSFPMGAGSLPARIGNDPRAQAHTSSSFGVFVAEGIASGSPPPPPPPLPVYVYTQAQGDSLFHAGVLSVHCPPAIHDTTTIVKTVQVPVPDTVQVGKNTIIQRRAQ